MYPVARRPAPTPTLRPPRWDAEIPKNWENKTHIYPGCGYGKGKRLRGLAQASRQNRKGREVESNYVQNTRPQRRRLNKRQHLIDEVVTFTSWPHPRTAQARGRSGLGSSPSNALTPSLSGETRCRTLWRMPSAKRKYDD